MMMTIVLICSPYRGRIADNEEKARRYSRLAVDRGCVPLAPHLLFPQFLDDKNPDERVMALTMSREVLARCDEIWVFGPVISKGMAYEISLAKELGVPFRLFHEDGQAIDPETMGIDDRVEPSFVATCRGYQVVYAGEKRPPQREPKKQSFLNRLFG